VLSVWTWLASVAPVVALFLLVATGRVGTRAASLAVAGLTVLLAATVFQIGGPALAVALGKGLWLGGWILYVVFPAMLLYRLAERAGFTRIGELFQHLFPNRSENLLVLAWLLPAFVQGVAGFGTPIAVAAPLLLASGWSRARAVAYPLIGYHWSVTFGSMGSSYYVAALTAHLGPAGSTLFAHSASLLLGVNCLVAGGLLLVMDGGWRGLKAGLPLLAGAGVPMALTLYAVTSVVPAIGSVAAGAVGFGCALTLARLTRRRGSRAAEALAVASSRTTSATFSPAPPVEGPDRAGAPGPTGAADEPADAAGPPRRAGWLVSPYLYLLGLALVVLLVPASRAWAEDHLTFGPDFPATTTGRGWDTEAVVGYTPLHLFTHPGTYLVLACILGYATYRLVGLWETRPARELVAAWFSSVKSSAVSIVSLACVATTMIQSGMIATLARGAVAATGPVYPVLAPLIGAVGSFLTGSTTSSNALFSSLQAQVAVLLDLPAPLLLAAQTAGANVGNSLAPVVLVIGISAVGGQVRASQVLRIALVPAVVLLTVVVAITALRVVALAAA
jgi:lactate permease